MENAIRALGLDYGVARIGVAGTDAIGMMAHPVETIHVKKVADPIGRIAELFESRKAEVIVVGLPLRMDGSRGTAVEKVEGWAAKIQERIPEAVIEFADERLSTVSAQEKLWESGRNTKNSRDVIDQAAAVVILQQWMDERMDERMGDS